MLGHFGRLRMTCRFVLRWLLRFRMRACLVRMTRRGFMRLARFSRVRVMMDHRFVTFGEQAEEQQYETRGHQRSKQKFISPKGQFGGPDPRL